MFELFYTFYLKNIYKETTAYQYNMAIKNICNDENITCQQLIEGIDGYIEKYRCEKYEENHYTNINAIRAFKSFCEWVKQNSEMLHSMIKEQLDKSPKSCYNQSI